MAQVMIQTAPLPAAGHARATLALGLPLIGSHLAQIGLHVTDTIMLGWYGVLPLAAGVLGATTFFILFILGAGFAKAVMPLVASAMGKGDEVQVRRVTRMGLWLSILFGIAIYPVFWWGESLLLLLGQAPDVAALAGRYMQIAGFGMIPALLVMTLKSYLAALGRTQVQLWVTLAAVGLNACLNWALIFGNWGAPEWGVAGSAVATVSVQIFTILVLVAYAALLPSLRRFQMFVRFWRPDWHAMREVFRLGWPMGLTGLAEGSLFQATALMMGWIGTVELAAHGIALEVTAVTFMIHAGLSNATTVRTGRAFGAGDAASLRLGALVAIAMSVAFALVTVAVFVTMPEPIIGLFLDLANPQAVAIIAYGSVLLFVSGLFQMADAMQVMALGLLAGVQDTRVPMWLATISYWLIGIPASYILAFPMGLGGPGLWLGLVIGLTVAAALLMGRFWRLAPR